MPLGVRGALELREGSPKVATSQGSSVISPPPANCPSFGGKLGEKEETDIQGAPTGWQEGWPSILITTLPELV